MMEACTLTLYQKNIFRVTGLPVDATSKEVSRQAQKLQMFEEMGGGATFPQPAFALATPPTTDEIRDALARMKEPESRIVDEFFWYWPEEFGASKSDPAIQAMLAGDAERAVLLWRDREKNGSHVALHNMAIMYHMFAVDWTNYHVSYDIDHALDDQITEYWRKSFERWEKIIEADKLWNMLKARVCSMEDEALTTGFVRRMLKQLPVALGRINAEAALKLAEQGRIDWARFHVDFMRQTNQGADDVEGISELVLKPTKKQVDQYLESFENEAVKTPQHGAELAIQLLERCRPMMDLYDLFHGEKAHQRNDLFDKVAETVLNMVVGHQKSTSDNSTFVDLLQSALQFASGSHIRERILKNIAIGEGNLKFDFLEPLFEQLKTLQQSKQTPSKKLKYIRESIMPKIPDCASKIGAKSSAYVAMMNTLALALRGISIDAHNDANDLRTAEDAIKLALCLAWDNDVKNRIAGDLKKIQESRGTVTCFFCGTEPGDPKKVVKVELHKVTERLTNGVRYVSNTIAVPRCESCHGKQNRHWRIMLVGAVAGMFIGAFVVPWSAVIGSGLAILNVGGWLSYLLLKCMDDGRLGAIGIIGTLIGAFSCINIAEETIGSNTFFNMIGGSIVGAFLSFWTARKLIHKATPQVLALRYDSIASLVRDGWLPGGEP